MFFFFSLIIFLSRVSHRKGWGFCRHGICHDGCHGSCEWVYGHCHSGSRLPGKSTRPTLSWCVMLYEHLGKIINITQSTRLATTRCNIAQSKQYSGIMVLIVKHSCACVLFEGRGYSWRTNRKPWPHCWLHSYSNKSHQDRMHTSKTTGNHLVKGNCIQKLSIKSCKWHTYILSEMQLKPK